MNVIEDIIAMVPHFFLSDQFFGFSGSWSAGSSHHTMFSSFESPRSLLAGSEVALSVTLAFFSRSMGSFSSKELTFSSLLLAVNWVVGERAAMVDMKIFRITPGKIDSVY
jgi:hypothetical protein